MAKSKVARTRRTKASTNGKLVPKVLPASGAVTHRQFINVNNGHHHIWVVLRGTTFSSSTTVLQVADIDTSVPYQFTGTPKFDSAQPDRLRVKITYTGRHLAHTTTSTGDPDTGAITITLSNPAVTTSPPIPVDYVDEGSP